MTLLLLVLQLTQLQITDIQTGDGNEAQFGDTIVVHYTGKLYPDGDVFDSSVTRGQPFEFILGKGQVIQGWEQGFNGMKEGGKRRLVIPPEMGYGNRAAGSIPANSTLDFEVELIQVKEGYRPWDTSGIAEQTRDFVKFWDVEEGEGDAAVHGDSVVYQYVLLNEKGVKLIDTFELNKAEQLVLGEGKHVIKGLENALVGMKLNGKRKMICESPFDDSPEPLIFELKLIRLVKND